MSRLGWGVALSLLALTTYLAAWPVPVEPVAWSAPVSPGYVGVHSPNQRLAGLQLIDLGDETGPEHVALGPDGWLYATVASGNILRMQGDGSRREVFATTGGRVLGFDFDAAGNLVAADAIKGLLSIAPDRTLRVLTDRVGGAGDDPIVYADAVAVARNGRIYVSDASTRFSPKRWGGTFAASFLDIIEQSATGRIIEFDPRSGHTRIVARGLSFANGLALSDDQRHLWVNETGRYRVWKLAVEARELDLGGPVAPELARVVLDNLPGFPDNLMRGNDGRIWLGFAKPRNTVIDRLAQLPLLRAAIFRLPRFLWPVPPTYGHVIAFDERGRIVADLQDPAGPYPETTAVTEAAGRCYVQSLHAHALGWFDCARVLAAK